MTDDQDVPDQLLATHMQPAHAEPLHDLADQSEPDQLLAFQSPPDHDFARASSEAIEAESKGVPKMSWLPDRVTPFIIR